MVVSLCHPEFIEGCRRQ